MKFTNGYWLVREGCSLFQAASVNDVEAGDRVIRVYADCHAGGGRKDLGSLTLTFDFFSPAKNVICVRITHHEGFVKNFPRFIDDLKTLGGRVEENGETLRLVSGDTAVLIRREGDWSVEFYYKDRFLTKSGWRSAGYARFDNSQAGGPGSSYIKEELSLGVGECVYGLGERFTSFIKNGQVVDIWNLDGGTGSEQAYKNIPFYLSDNGYGVLVNDTGKVSFEVAAEKVERVQFSVPGEQLEYYLFGGEDPASALKTYTAFMGKPALPPAWSFGLWLTTSFTTDYDEKTVNSFIDGMKERDIPLHVFHFDCFWMKGNHWCNFEWDTAVFPDPAGMLKRLHEKGLKICVWINPYIAQRSHLFDEGLENGYFIKRKDGSVWQTDDWQPGMAIVDFTNPDAVRWYQGELKRLLDQGVDTFKTDFGERIPWEDVIYASGADPVRMHNYYTYLYNKAVFGLLQRERGEGNALVFARSATAGGQRFPVHWGGDCVASYESMAESLRGGLSLASSGFGFWSHDMGGFESKAPADLYKRWVAFGMLSTHSRLHGNSSYRVPWLFDEEAVTVLRHFTKLKCSLMPYLFSQAVYTHREGLPMMRPMFLAFPGDPVAGFLDRQYMLGDSLLVAPVFSPAGKVRYYLPQGNWIGLLDGKLRTGGWYEETYDYLGLPLMVRGNSLIAVKEDANGEAVYDYLADPVLNLYALEDGKIASAEIHSASLDKHAAVKAARRGNTIHVAAEGLGTWRLRLHGMAPVKAVSGAEYDKNAGVIRASGGAQEVEITMIT
ncbi:MAG: alpha-xylosidase [Treponema sp.]|jgi:alpha-D-xyloside xylohydrolase|nr:alpha-xylosidase [Treponema sp.]